jgi:tRNA1(Val) A37 N6-methylase TrmN6
MNQTKVSLPFTEQELIQLSGGHPVTDAADFLQTTIAQQTTEVALNGLELGSGNGIVSIMLALQKPRWTLTGIEIQPELHSLSETNAIRTGVQCSFINADLRQHKGSLRHGGYQLIYSNPPWVKAGTGMVSPDEARAISRQEITCTLKDILSCLEWCLSTEGTAWLIYPLERKPELAREVRFTALEIVNIIQNESYPRLFITKLRHKALEKMWY